MPHAEFYLAPTTCALCVVDSLHIELDRA